MIPKFHGEKLVDIPDEQLAECLVCIFQKDWERNELIFGVDAASSEEDCKGYGGGEL